MDDFASQITIHLPRLRRYARSLTHDRAQADDLVQATMVRALEKASLFQQDTNLSGWLVTIMHNEHVTSVRRAMRRPFCVANNQIREIGCPETQQAPIELGEIRRAVDRLPAARREALLLNWLHGLTYEEIAAKLKLPVGTVQSRIFRARQALRQIVETPSSGIGLANAPIARKKRRRPAFTVLVVDDNADVRELAAAALSSEGYNVSEAADGNEALKIAALARVDLLFTDIRMPGMDGYELARRAKLDRPHLPVIFTTGLSGTTPRHGEPEHGPLLQKPWHHHQLVSEIARALRC